LSHSYPLTTGRRESEPLRSWLGCTPGAIAVDLFFLISGLLVTASLVRRRSIVDFVRARFFRIWPGLTVALMLTVFLLGPAYTSHSLHDYFASRGTWRYLLQNLLILHGIDVHLPGVFLQLPWPDAVNGSLWSLPIEVSCYLYLLAIWFVLHKLFTETRFRLLVGCGWLAFLAWHFAGLRYLSLEDSPGRLYYMFCSGAALYVFKDHIVLSKRWLAAAGLALALSTIQQQAFAITYSLLLPYAMAGLAFLPRGPILRFNRLGDYSYGTYIYAFPIQQALVATLPSLGVAGLVASSAAITLCLAVASWHFVEKPALRLARSKAASVAPTP
jgi:peptidoglycan/LPS O-acetylase OafA/YrhL